MFDDDIVLDKDGAYNVHSHLALAACLLGPPPKAFQGRSEEAKRFFAGRGEIYTGVKN